MIKKEGVRLEKDRVKLQAILGGILELRKHPSAVFIMDIKKEFIALNEAKKLGIPIISVVDTNCDPRGVDYVIPGNDDSIHCIKLFSQVIASASIEGRKIYETKMDTIRQEKLKAEQESKERRMKLRAEAARKQEAAEAKKKQETAEARKKQEAEKQPEVAKQEPKAEKQPEADPKVEAAE